LTEALAYIQRDDDPDGAFESLGHAIDALESLHATGDEVNATKNLAWAYFMRSYLEDRGDIEGAYRDAEKSLALRKALLARQSDNVYVLSELA
jgi:hypothetical protein